MTPKEKAIKLVDKFIHYVNCWDDETADPNYTQAYNYSKQCASIAVNEIIKANPIIETRIIKNGCSWIESKTNINYWQEVKQEIEKL
jgi:hypothetical protein